MLKAICITPPSVEPIALAVAKQHLRVDYTDDDTLIPLYISAARDYAETYTARAFLPQTWQLSLNVFPFNMQQAWPPASRLQQRSYLNSQMEILLPVSPLMAVNSIIYQNPPGTVVTMDASQYTVNTGQEPGSVTPANGVYWPFPMPYVPDTVQINYQCGYPLGVQTDYLTMPTSGPLQVTLKNPNFAGLVTVYGQPPTGGGYQGPYNNQDFPVVNGVCTFDPTSMEIYPDFAGWTMQITYNTYSIPPAITQALLLLIAEYYQNRSPQPSSAKSSTMDAVHALLSKYKVDWQGYDYE